MAITPRSPNGTATVAYGTRTNITVSRPSGMAAGDVALVGMTCGGSTLVQPDGSGITGAELIGRVSYSAPDPWSVDVSLWAVPYAAGASWTWTHASHASQAFAIALVGVDATTMQDVAATFEDQTTGDGGNAANATAPALTIATAGAWAAIVRGSWDGNGITAPSGWTERHDTPVLWVGTREYTTTGSTGAVAVPAGNGGSGSPWGIVMGALRPAGAGGGTTPVTATRNTTWRVTAAASSVRTASWDVRVVVASTRPSTWRVLAQPAATRVTSWDVRTHVTAQRSSTWNVDGTISQVTTTRATTWRTTAAATSTRSTTWRTTAAVATVRTASWDVRQTVTATRSASWDTRSTVTSTRSASWDTYATVSRALATSWDVRRDVTAQRSSTWNVDSTMTAVSTQRATSWRTLARPTSTRSTSWDTRAIVANTRAAAWDVRVPATKTTSTTWCVRTAATSTRSTTWRTCALVTGARSTTWRTESDLIPPRYQVAPARRSGYTAGDQRAQVGLTAGPPRPTYRAGDPR